MHHREHITTPSAVRVSRILTADIIVGFQVPPVYVDGAPVLEVAKNLATVELLGADNPALLVGEVRRARHEVRVVAFPRHTGVLHHSVLDVGVQDEKLTQLRFLFFDPAHF